MDTGGLRKAKKHKFLTDNTLYIANDKREAYSYNVCDFKVTIFFNVK